MSKRKLPWQYSNAAYQRCGRMVCTVCNAQITQGDYRYREAYDDRGYHAHAHRDCLPEDQQEWWKVQEEKQRKVEIRNIEYREACKVFRDKWESSALDDEISELEHLQ